MTSERRFTDDEVALILERATMESPALTSGEAPPRETGLSLSELTAIATEAGIDPQAVVRAAHAVERGDLVPATVRLANGAPIAVAKSIDFGREIDDRTWARIVVHLQETFAARGRLRTEGAFREWSNGNLRAVLEPTPHGHRLRVSTVKGDAATFRVLGNAGLLAGIGTAGLVAARALLGDAPVAPELWYSPLMLAVMGAAAHVRNAVTLRSWGRERAAQMESLPEALRALVPAETSR